MIYTVDTLLYLPKLWLTHLHCSLLTDKSSVSGLIVKNVRSSPWDDLVTLFYRLEANGDGLLSCILCYRWRSLSITYELLGELSPKICIFRGGLFFFPFTPPARSVKWTQLTWACLIKRPEFLFTLPVAAVWVRVDNCFVIYISFFHLKCFYRLTAAHLYSWKQSSTAVLHQGLASSPCSQGRRPCVNCSPGRWQHGSENAENMWHLINLTPQAPSDLSDPARSGLRM